MVEIQHKFVYLEGFRDSGLGGLIDLSLPDAPTSTLPQLTQTEAQILLISIIFNLEHHVRNYIKCAKELIQTNDISERSLEKGTETEDFTVSSALQCF